MELTPLKQQFHHSCLVTSLMMISRMSDQSIEGRIFFEGEKREFEFYISSILESFVENTMLSFELLVDNKSFADRLTQKQNRKNKRIKIKHQKITLELIKELTSSQSIIVHVDDNIFGRSTHSSHFIVIEKILPGSKLQIIDPADGKAKIIHEQRLEEAISSLKNHLKFAPIILRKIGEK